MRDIRLQISVSRQEMDKLAYLAEVAGQSLSKYCYYQLAQTIDQDLPEGSEQAYYYDLARRLKRAGQGFRGLEEGELDARVKEAIEHGATGVKPTGNHGAEADPGTLPSVPVQGTNPSAAGRHRTRGRKGQDAGVAGGTPGSSQPADRATG